MKVKRFSVSPEKPQPPQRGGMPHEATKFALCAIFETGAMQGQHLDQAVASEGRFRGAWSGPRGAPLARPVKRQIAGSVPRQ